MDKYLKGSIHIERSISFLCGPYFNGKNPGDRRTVLLSFLKDTYDGRVIPLIIDDFLISENIKDSKINIQLLEEIFAAISSCTYIFLDTMSAASELGLFVNHSANNIVHIFLPYPSDILHNSVGYFVQNAVIAQNKDKIRVDYYRPKIKKVAFATDFVTEHYEFINDMIPAEIASKMIDENGLSVISTEICVKRDSSIPYEFGMINYMYDDNKVIARISVKTLFYLIASITYSIFNRTILKDKTIDKATDGIITNLCDAALKIIQKTIDVNIFGNDFLNYDIELVTIINRDMMDIVKHILKFIILYHENEPRNGHSFITETNDLFLRNVSDMSLINSLNVFDLTSEEYKLIKEINLNKNDFFEQFVITRNRKKRTLCKYISSEKGTQVYNLHKKIESKIIEHFHYSENSYAYQQGKSAVKCVKIHKNSKCFVKFDVKSFFNSISIDDLSIRLLKYMKIDTAYKHQLERILETCVFDGKIPLGFCISPLLSEVYMKRFDDVISDYAQAHNLIYTRYADDILISSMEILSESDIEYIKKEVESTLKIIKLKINSKKYRVGMLKRTGHHFKYLGVNIVHKENENTITVGKSYKNSVAKNYLKYLSIPKEGNENKKRRFYEAKRISGQISFVKQVEGIDGYSYITERISKCTNGRLIINTDKIHFD